MTVFVTREEWGARPRLSAPAAIVSEVATGHWEGTGLWGGVIGSHGSCATKVRAIQAYHMDHQGWTDIAYNCLACPHDFLYEGRGPGVRSAANGTNYSNGVSPVCCYLGGMGDPFTLEGKRAMIAGAWYLGVGLERGHRDWFATACPGDEVYDWIHAGCPMPVDPIPVPPAPQPKEQRKMDQCIAPDGTLWVFGRGVDDHGWVTWCPAGKDPNVPANWVGPLDLGGLFTGGMSIVAQPDGTLRAAGIGTNLKRYSKTRTPAGVWSGGWAQDAPGDWR